MRVSNTGGPAQRLFTARPLSLLTCARSLSELCVIGEPTEDGKQLVVIAIDLVKGQGPEFFRFALVANDDNWYLDLSPDGTRVAATRTLKDPIYILSLSGKILQEVQVNGWSNLQSLTWAADGKGLFVRRHGHSVKVSTFMVKPVHSLVFMRIYQEPERLTITKGFVATKRS